MGLGRFVGLSGDERAIVRDTFEQTQSLAEAAAAAGVTEAEATDILRAEGIRVKKKGRFSGASRKAFEWIGRRFEPLVNGTINALSRSPRARRAGQRLAAWASRAPSRNGIGAMVLASIFFAWFWLVPPGWQPFVGFLFLLNTVIGASLIYHSTGSRRVLGAISLLLIASLTYFITSGIAIRPTISVNTLVVVEGLRAVLIALIGWAFVDLTGQALGFFSKLRAHVPLIGTLTPLLLIFGGTIAAFGELYISTVYSGEPSTVQFVARYGFAYFFWALAGVALVFTNVYLLYIATLATRGPLTTRRIAVAMVTGILLIVFVGSSFVIILGTQLSPKPTQMIVGVHTVNVTAAYGGPWDPYVHIEVVWANVEPDEGVYNWSAYDYQLDYADAHGIEVLLMLNPVPPIWFEEKYADATMVDQSGRAFLWVDTDPRSNGTRIWEFSFAAEEVTAARENFTMVAGARYASRPSVVAIAVQNEPTYPSDVNPFRLASYDRYTIEAFRAWLQAKYGNVDSMNAALGTSYASLANVTAPDSALSPLWQDWLRLREDLLTQYVDRLVVAARSVTTKPITVKIMAIFVSRYVIIQTALSERVIRSYVNASDVVSLDLYAMTRADLLHTLEYYKTSIGNKPIWAAEFNMFLSTALPLTGAQMFSALVDLSQYAQRVTVFTWEPHYLYGLRIHYSVPGIQGIAMYRAYRDGGSPWLLWPSVMGADLVAVPNVYEVYTIYSSFANIPVIPWPALLLLLIPIPIANLVVRKRWKRRLIYTALAIFAVAIVYSNLIAPY